MNLPFRLHGLSGCPHCQHALEYLTNAKMPFDAVLADNDPIIAAGAEKITGRNEFPILISRLTSEIISGFKPEDYDRLAKVFATLVRTGSLDLTGSGQPVGGENPAPAPAVGSAAN
jgi:glutaredoxin